MRRKYYYVFLLMNGEFTYNYKGYSLKPLSGEMSMGLREKQIKEK